MEKFDELLKDPSRYYSAPRAIEEDKNLSREQQLRLLESWASDEERLQVATEENMGGGESSCLDRGTSRVIETAPGSVFMWAMTSCPDRDYTGSFAIAYAALRRRAATFSR
jgi:hypothetical protein